ncbi:THUMP domain-containing protein 1 [Clonorchis sinensis]|uniref:THUMP domain-containing protein 1 n=1 Tax=Clonorchis sinensis TaxID=79923 RepID=A0A8T1M4H9_CLOSI|nr:THUMP domain-containing protein 1 [Clonorchis sinensis]
MAPHKANLDRKKRKAYYRKSAAACKRQKMASHEDPDRPAQNIPKSLESGMTGYLITCNQKERSAMLESFRLLNDALSRITSSPIISPSGTQTSECPQLQYCPKPPQTSPCDGDDEDDDILSELRRENADTDKPLGSGSSTRFSFYSIRSGVSNCLFLIHLSESASAGDIVHSIFQHLLGTKVPQSRYVLRLLPVAATCQANCVDLKQCIRKLWTAFLGTTSVNSATPAAVTHAPDNSDAAETKITNNSCSRDPSSSVLRFCPNVPPQRAKEQTMNGPKTFLVMFKARNYNLLSRDNAIEATVSAVQSVDSSWRISPSAPSVIIYVNVLRTVACISLLEDFDLYRKYNVSELLVDG